MCTFKLKWPPGMLRPRTFQIDWLTDYNIGQYLELWHTWLHPPLLAMFLGSLERTHL